MEQGKPRIVESKPREVIIADLERYAQEAINLGATDAKVITTGMVFVDDRVPLKCRIPKCHEYGASGNCPPYSLTPAETRELVKNYHYGVLIQKTSRSRGMANPEVAANLQKGRVAPEALEPLKRLYTIPARIEAMAFYDGYYFAVGFGGACKLVFCPEMECSAIKPGGSCRFPLKSRPSMEACGMDVFKMVTRAGWDIYPIGASCIPSEVPHGMNVFLVLVT